VKIKILNLILAVAMVAMAAYVAGCGGGDDNPVEPPPPVPTILKVIVRSSADSSLVENSNVVLYDANSSEAILRDLTDADGAVHFETEVGNYYLDISAQGFNEIPPENIAPVPFFVAREDTTIQDISLNVREDLGGAGYVMGHVEPAVNNFLILAESQSGQDKYATVSGPDGFFVLYNLPFGSYDLDALKSGYRMDGPVDASISQYAEVDTVQILISEYQGSTLSGSVTFLASENSTVDITLLDPVTRAVVPGLSVMSDIAGLNYRIENIPDGEYIAWASLKNDGYVIDPDWVFKNPGGLDVSFTTSETRELNFSVTDVIQLVSPTNPADSTFAFMAESQVPVFRWLPYPSAKEYFIEVKDLSGDVLWGGFDEAGIANHAFIGANMDRVAFDFDNQPGVAALRPGEIYQWKIWADKGTMQDGVVEQLISSSEDLRGIFQVPEGPSGQ
jgi:hypothetical protein